MQSNKEFINIKEELNKKKVNLIIKRLFDIVASSIGLILLSPILILIAICIKLDSKGPVFFKQVRVGKNKELFKIYKFRTMVTDAEKLGKQITVGNDTRITKVGTFIRKCKLDELPQLINVLKGDMSLVGPRPEVPKYVDLYDDYQEQILLVQPGITDYASIEFRNESEILGESENPESKYIDDIMPYKIELNIKYIKNISLYEDLKLITRTIKAIAK
ncbi:sugar transferase [[Clostridium] sordellii]|uniref:sugar transferase n=1 Tax=Paraclostridium sordellii TaxID=1505 RepID=UPI0005443874|nr:sugar transferase [Paeniclostridium sordellii]CEK32831.1 sugar transferase,Putative colanic biosynthesis UDP-glucose lipid carrier transferase,putative UDP-glucose lipid carrier transferase,exopolysaccharide biosynthesis polyprenyl glycosylphosphotransferase,Bacterial sugar transferase [[Clostridium] sordellii] [Paeniclostridium sordellii]CEP47824.1 sugar transferase [[Clostridium] sordellii] [Paeniclostridium sordellii]